MYNIPENTIRRLKPNSKVEFNRKVKLFQPILRKYVDKNIIVGISPIITTYFFNLFISSNVSTTSITVTTEFEIHKIDIKTKNIHDTLKARAFVMKTISTYATLEKIDSLLKYLRNIMDIDNNENNE
jgi:hypothetical protein